MNSLSDSFGDINSMRLISILILIFTLTVAAAAQKKYDVGRPSEMKGLTKLFIDTRADFKNLERLTNEFRKQKVPGIELVDRVDDADMVLLYNGEQNDMPAVDAAGSRTGSTYEATASLRTIPLIAGEGMVFIVSGVERARLVFRYSNQQETQWEQKPTTKLVKVFARAYREANGLK